MKSPQVLAKQTLNVLRNLTPTLVRARNELLREFLLGSVSSSCSLLLSLDPLPVALRSEPIAHADALLGLAVVPLSGFRSFTQPLGRAASPWTDIRIATR